MKSHISHLLGLADTRFQRHLSFIFVMMNIIQRRNSSFKLAFTCMWFPKVSEALKKVDSDSLTKLQSKLNKNPYAQPENEGEKAAFDLLNYVNYISDHISGSTAEVNAMREEIRAIICSRGLPHLFIIINPADAHNPIAQVLAGRKIDLDEFFHNLSPQSEVFEQAKLIAENPVAGAKAFKVLIDAF
ncbi:hypothetical protein K439DRAFT_1325878 [Ramaria rubella]|nr:hypothetical protein K439DRAFT_1325878 [Ramaria rubella]